MSAVPAPAPDVPDVPDLPDATRSDDSSVPVPVRAEATPRGAWTAWTIGVTVYVLAVVHRTSLGVAGLDAASRFGINASALSAFSILQVLVYAGMQIPVGLLVDRLGPRRVLTAGLVLLTAGQLGFAFATAFGPALAARAVLGCGDAMTFVSVLRIASRWFPPRRGPFIAQLTGLVGTVGNLVSTLVLSRVLHSAGWTPTFATTGLVGVGVLALVLLGLRETPQAAPGLGAARRRVPAQRTAPPGAAALGVPAAAVAVPVGAAPAGAVPSGAAPAVAAPAGAAPAVAALLAQIRAAWAEPGTRMGMWVHFTTAFPASTFLLLWGMPFLMDGQGMSRAGAGALLSLVIAAGMVFAVAFGQLMSRRPGLRTPTALAVVGVTGALWAVVLAWPGPHVPLWLLVVLAVVMGSNGPASLIGLDYARPVNPPERVGTAAGIVNMGGFVAAVLALFGVGLVLDLLTPGGGAHYSTHAFRMAFCMLYVPMALGLAQMLRLRGRAARRERELRAVRPRPVAVSG